MNGRARLILLVVSVLVLAACGTETEPEETDAPATTSAPQVTEAPDGTEAPDDTEPVAEDGGSEEALADLREAVEGSSLVIGTSSFPNASLTGQYRTVDYLEENFGVDVDFRVLDSDPLVAATISGQVDVGALSLAGMANANEAGAEFIAFGADDQKNTFTVLAKPPIETMEQVEGQTFGVTQNLNQITGQTAQMCLQEAGLTIDDVELLQLGNTGEVTQAIATDQIAAGISATFRVTQLILEEGEEAYNVLCRGWESNPQISSIWYADRTWVEENQDLALALNVASLQSARWAAESKEDWVAYATEVIEGLTPEAAAVDYDTLLTELDNWPVNGSMDQELMQQTLDTSLEFDAVERAYTVDELATFEFQEQAVDILGEA